MSFTGILPVRSMGYTAKLISLTREDAKGMTFLVERFCATSLGAFAISVNKHLLIPFKGTVMTRLIYGVIKVISLTFCFLLFSSCSKVPRLPLRPASFMLKGQRGETENLFGKVKQIQIDQKGNLYVLDSERFFIYKFNPEGKFLAKLCGEGNQLGQMNKPTSFDVYGDSLILIYNIGSIDLLDSNGKGVRSLYLNGRADVSVSPGGQIIINRMLDALEYGYFLEGWDLQGNSLFQLRPTRGPVYKNSLADFAFTGFTDDNRLVYAPSAIDSLYLYDMKGRLQKKAKRFSGIKSSPKKLEFDIEDMCVHNNRIYLLKVDHGKTTEEKVYIREALQYNLDLSLERIYKLPQPITMTVMTDPWAPWYHKFLVADKHFLFMASEPSDHLLAYTYGE